MKILLIVPDGVGVRNYLYSDVVREFESHGAEVMLYHQLSSGALSEITKLQPGIKTIRPIPFFIENFKARILRESTAYARLLHNVKILKNPTIMAFWGKNPKLLKQKILYGFSESLGRLLSKSYSWILKSEAAYETEILKSSIIDAVEKDLEYFNPDYILNLHQRSPISAPVIAVAKKRKIPTATVIFSWDNVPKGRLISRYDRYFVWSELMKNELSLLYPEIQKDAINVVGTPQFEFYFKDEFLQNREYFCTKYGLNPDKKTVCFSANDESSVYEPNYLADVCEAVTQIPENQRPQILFRRCPVDKSKRFEAILEKYKENVIVIDPDWRIDSSADITNFTSVYPAFEDVKILANTVKHCDVVVNLGSTMAHDFAVYDKPCLYVNYDCVPNPKVTMKEVYDFEHFRSMRRMNAVGWINSKKEIGDKIMQAIQSPKNVGPDRKKWLEKVVLHPLNNCSKNLVNEIVN